MQYSQLMKLSVQTKGGIELGRVEDMVYDIESHTIVQYIVRSGMLRQKEYRVHPSQVLTITTTTMIVEDTCIYDGETESTSRRVPSGASPAMMRDEG
jgi:sporulation protein YlmC with PRC-barrel domain